MHILTSISDNIKKYYFPFILILLVIIFITLLLSSHKKKSLGQKNKTVKQQYENRPANRNHPYGGTLVWGTCNKPTIINPILTSHSISMSLLELIFNRLVRINSKGHIESDLAKSWELSKDKLTYTFHLRKGVLFHDGIECTAEDVLFTYQQIINPNNHSPFRCNFELVEKLEAPDKYTFKITLKKPFPAFIYKLVREIVPAHILKGKDLHTAKFNYHPIGTGPFMFKSWDRTTDTIELTANPIYFEGRPYLDKIIIKTYSDTLHLWSGLMRHEIDLAQYLNPRDYRILRNDKSFNTYSVPWGVYYAIAYNLRDHILSDRNIRRAIAYGINVQRLIQDLYEGEGIISTGPFHPESIGFNPNVKIFKYNPVRARMELMHRGWKDIDGDGIVEKGGEELCINMLVNAKDTVSKKLAAYIRQYLSGIGIKLKVVLYNDEKQLTDKYLKNHHIQAWLRLYQGLSDDPDAIAGTWASEIRRFGKIWCYKNKEVDKLFEQARHMDKNKCAKIYKKINNIVYADQAVCFLFYPVGLHATSSRIANTKNYFCIHMPIYTIKDWYIKNNGKKSGYSHLISFILSRSLDKI